MNHERTISFRADLADQHRLSQLRERAKTPEKPWPSLSDALRFAIRTAADQFGIVVPTHLQNHRP